MGDLTELDSSGAASLSRSAERMRRYRRRRAKGMRLSYDRDKASGARCARRQGASVSK